MTSHRSEYNLPKDAAIKKLQMLIGQLESNDMRVMEVTIHHNDDGTNSFHIKTQDAVRAPACAED